MGRTERDRAAIALDANIPLRPIQTAGFRAGANRFQAADIASAHRRFAGQMTGETFIGITACGWKVRVIAGAGQARRIAADRFTGAIVEIAALARGETDVVAAAAGAAFIVGFTVAP